PLTPRELSQSSHASPLGRGWPQAGWGVSCFARPDPWRYEVARYNLGFELISNNELCRKGKDTRRRRGLRIEKGGWPVGRSIQSSILYLPSSASLLLPSCPLSE